MKVLVAGGTGFLGRAITKAALDAGHDVTVLSRHKSANVDPRAKVAIGDVVEPEGLSAQLAGFNAVVDAVQFPNSPIENPKKGNTFERIDLGGTKNLVDAAKKADVPLFIGLSGVGAGEHAEFHWLRFKWQEEQHIARSGVPFIIFRPSWIYGPGDVSLNRFLGFAKFLPFVPVIGNGKTRIAPLFIDDLAAHVVAALDRPDLRGRVFEIGGPDQLVMDSIIRTALQSAGKKRILIHNPKWFMKFIASIVQHAPGRPLTPDAIDFITMDGLADVESLRAAFQLPLTPLAEGTRTYL
ncbi:hypothetical protein AYO38_06630 [bacterium SCGC AG-212-C10]|nr:hypothetical protein AYO38_06630 [bacterium SCGC AG-212-C10]